MKTSLNKLIENTKIIDRTNNRKELLIKEALHYKKKILFINVQNRNFNNVLKLVAINNTIERNKNHAKSDSIIYFNKNQIEFCSTPIRDLTLDLDIRYKKLLT